MAKVGLFGGERVLGAADAYGLGPERQAAQRSWSVGRADEEQGDVVIAGRGLFGVMEKGVGEGVNRGRKRA
ncbi:MULTISPECIES: hypothetical protein [unclassified Streptomyces]|uniref:hypothetical protein n=1 Tax=Streptomyces sp. NPDC056663 TaxID=3345899 RepID=UPI002F916F73